jgi:hypothetical protein
MFYQQKKIQSLKQHCPFTNKLQVLVGCKCVTVIKQHLQHNSLKTVFAINPLPANVENMVSSE